MSDRNIAANDLLANNIVVEKTKEMIEDAIKEHPGATMAAGACAAVGAIIAGPIGAAIGGALGGYVGGVMDEKKD